MDGDTPNINKITNSELFHCPFCKYVGAKFKVDYHVKGHSSVKHKGAYLKYYTNELLCIFSQV